MAKKFENLTIEEQKMRIVTDAIKQIKFKKIVPTTGDYLKMFRKNKTKRVFKKAGSIKEFLNLPEVYCEACAKGAIFASCVMINNKVKGEDNFSDESFQKEKLSKWFPLLELDMIEAAFEVRVVQDTTNKLEKSVGPSWYKKPTTMGSKAINFGRKYDDDEKRLLAILENILQNGKFKP